MIQTKGWEIKTLGDVCSVFADGDWIESKDQSLDGVRLIQTGNVGNGFFKDRGEKARYISEDTFKRIQCTEIIEGDCLISRLPDPVGRACVLPNTGEKMITAVDCTIIRFKPKTILSEWFVFYSLSIEYQNQINSEVSGATRQRISRKNLGQINIPLPTLPEQRRIVTILDEAFAAIAKAKANAEQNLKNAKELFESYLQGVFENKGEGWEETAIKSEIDLMVGFAFKSKDYTEIDDDILLLRGDNIMQGYLRWEDAKRWKRSEYEDFKKYQLQENDIVLAMDRPWVKSGLKIARLSKSDLPALLVQRTACLRTKPKLDNSFLFYLLKSKGFMNYLIGVQTGIGVPHISGQQILDFSFNKPSIKLQQTIVTRLDALSAETKRLEAIYQKKIVDLEELKKSVLQKAFNGEL